MLIKAEMFCPRCKSVFDYEDCKKYDVKDDRGFVMEREAFCPHCHYQDIIDIDDDDVIDYCTNEYSVVDFLLETPAGTEAMVNVIWDTLTVNQKLYKLFEVNINDNAILKDLVADEFRDEFIDYCLG